VLKNCLHSIYIQEGSVVLYLLAQLRQSLVRI